MEKAEKLESFSLYGTGVISVDGYGHVEVDGKNLGKVIAEHIGIETDTFSETEFYGVITVKITPYQHKALGVVRDDF